MPSANEHGTDLGPQHTNMEHLPNIPKAPNEKTCFINCWLQVWGYVLRVCWKMQQATKMGVSKNSGTPKSSILIGLSIVNHPFWGTVPLFLETSKSNQYKHHLPQPVWQLPMIDFVKMAKPQRHQEPSLGNLPVPSTGKTDVQTKQRLRCVFLLTIQDRASTPTVILSSYDWH